MNNHRQYRNHGGTTHGRDSAHGISAEIVITTQTQIKGRTLQAAAKHPSNLYDFTRRSLKSMPISPDSGKVLVLK